jgi:peptidoglycan/LPS O-acetylase OafA/YrhL
MSHSAVIWVINQFFRVVMKRPEIIVNSQSTPQLDKAETFITWIIVVTLVLVLSKFVFYFIEKPMREKSRLIAFSKLN